MSNIWLTSDTHLNHAQPFIWRPRGFNSVYEMNEAIIENWNKVVKWDDIVYHLGDVMLGENEAGLKLLKQLNGKIYLALGNHDSDARVELYNYCYNIADVEFGYRIKGSKKTTLLLTHYPQLVANHDDPKLVYSIHGHTHSKDKWSEVPHAYNVNMDAHNCTPVNFEDMMADIRRQRDIE